MKEKSFRMGTIEATIWSNKTKPKINETERTFYTFSITKSFKKDGVWSDTKTLMVHDLPKIESLARMCREYIELRHDEF
jgi:hypothetical protein